MRAASVLVVGCAVVSLMLVPACVPIGDTSTDDGPIAEGIQAPMGEPLPTATAEQLATFERGKAVALKRFDLSQGLGPAFNVTFCTACHERPATGGSSALYRNFFLTGRLSAGGIFVPGESAGMAGGVIRVYDFGGSATARPAIPADTTIFAQRNGIPFFGVGLIAELDESVILANADESDANGDGISGRPNYDRGFVGRFGRKAQTVSIEAFIRGPLFNHLGITTNPLSATARAQLPVDSLAAKRRIFPENNDPKRAIAFQAAAPDGATVDSDGVPDPEMSPSDLFDLVSFSMLLAGPEFEQPTQKSNAGRLLFHDLGCAACHVPRLDGPRGPLPLYSDLLLHDMGDGLADGIEQGVATGSEFRTQPLWGLAAVGPYLHDGRAQTVQEAILAHGGEAQAARDAFDALRLSQQDNVVEFLMTLGGRSQTSPGLHQVDDAIPDVGEYGGPYRELTSAEQDRFKLGRALFDRDFGVDDGVGAPGFNGDSCRACHVDPVMGGAGPRDVNVMRHGFTAADGTFTAPTQTINTILEKQVRDGNLPNEPEPGINTFEHRQTPPLFGLGLVDAISEDTILSNADPDDTDGDGISGRANVLPDGRIGRLGWKADVPSLAEFTRDGFSNELGMTVPPADGFTFGFQTDDDGIADPEVSLDDADDLTFFLSVLAPPPPQEAADVAQAQTGAALFITVGCTKCHIPSLPSDLGDVPLFSDLLLHEILPEGATGVVSQSATPREFRTAPLWGLSQTAPYFHSGEADTIDEAIRLHDGEAAGVIANYRALDAESQAALLAFLNTL